MNVKALWLFLLGCGIALIAILVWLSRPAPKPKVAARSPVTGAFGIALGAPAPAFVREGHFQPPEPYFEGSVDCDASNRVYRIGVYLLPGDETSDPALRKSTLTALEQKYGLADSTDKLRFDAAVLKIGRGLLPAKDDREFVFGGPDRIVRVFISAATLHITYEDKGLSPRRKPEVIDPGRRPEP